MDVSVLYPSRRISLDCPQIHHGNFAVFYLMGSGSYYASGPIILPGSTWVGLGPIKLGPGTKAQGTAQRAAEKLPWFI